MIRYGHDKVKAFCDLEDEETKGEGNHDLFNNNQNASSSISNPSSSILSGSNNQ